MAPRPLPPREVPKNPFLKALLTIGIVALVVGGIFALYGASISANSSGGADTSMQFIWASIFAGFGSLTMLLWIHASAQLWKPGR